MSVRYISSSIQDDDDKIYLRRVYYNLRNSVNSMINNLKSSINYLNNINSDFTIYYCFDYTGADSGMIDESKRQLQQRVKYLENVVVPAIDHEISKLY